MDFLQAEGEGGRVPMDVGAMKCSGKQGEKGKHYHDKEVAGVVSGRTATRSRSARRTTKAVANRNGNGKASIIRREGSAELELPARVPHLWAMVSSGEPVLAQTSSSGRRKILDGGAVGDFSCGTFSFKG